MNERQIQSIVWFVIDHAMCSGIMNNMPLNTILVSLIEVYHSAAYCVKSASKTQWVLYINVTSFSINT